MTKNDEREVQRKLRVLNRAKARWARPIGACRRTASASVRPQWRADRPLRGAATCMTADCRAIYKPPRGQAGR